jgi:hypothetical protein
MLRHFWQWSTILAIVGVVLVIFLVLVAVAAGVDILGDHI